ncbi:MAG: beta-ketoacyl synthase N-terminal-like domain-containing protein, partial [Planctomycetaceae bacterium]
MRRRVVVTGMGCVTPIGSTVEEMSAGLYSGRIGVGRVTLFNPDQFPVRIAAEVRNWDLSAVGEDPVRWKHCPRQTRFAIGAGLQAADRSGINSSPVDPQRFGVYLGCGEPFEDFQAFTQSVHDSLASGGCDADRFVQHALRVFDPEAEREYEPDMAAIHLGGL